MKRLILILFAIGSAASATFDVASVKVSNLWNTGDERTARESIETSPLSLTMRNVSLSSAIKWARGVKDYQIAAPEWLKSERYDIAAKTSVPATGEQLKIMLQALLADRFKLALHREKKALPVYTLLAAKSGPRLHKAEPGGNTGMHVENGSFVFTNTSMPYFAETLSTLRPVGRPVLDETGIKGAFDFNLKFADSNDEMKRTIVQDSGPSIFTLIQEQLGLKLTPAKAPVDVLVIDRADKVPTDN